MTQFADDYNLGLEGLGGIERDLLYIIASCDGSSGQTIKGPLQEYYDEEINHGRLYSNLDRLVDKGLVSRGKINNRANSYALTNAGRTAIQTHVAWKRQYTQR